MTPGPTVSADLGISPTKTATSFSDHMLASSGGDLTNAIQYAVLALLPCSALFYAVSSVAVPCDANASTIQLVVETAAILALTIVGLYYINRLITYVPTYSGMAYGEMPFLAVVLAVVAVIAHYGFLGARGSLGHKSRLGVLQARCTAALEGDDVRQKRPAAPQHQAPAQTGPPPPVATQNTVPASSLPVGHPSDPPSAPQHQPQAEPNFDTMYQPFQTGAGQEGSSWGSSI